MLFYLKSKLNYVPMWLIKLFNVNLSQALKYFQ
ncbi:hypothetical protein B0I22_0594 [Epilithonimonas xixisoli]|uniref:Uncharacterized protein n=1 Tax=Epilithonimonas xixisoli TaxID=1476462 RepID=A0A4R8I905_9FLAO|nr:hypothetical protein B0I22_0594 [Epilithonimonas xixisoli]